MLRILSSISANATISQNSVAVAKPAPAQNAAASPTREAAG